jgi:hypothetical protein
MFASKLKCGIGDRYGMETKTGNPVVEAAVGAMVADGFFGLAFLLHLLNNPAPASLADFLGMGVILSVLVTACWVIYDDYWRARRVPANEVKSLRINELKQGATIEFDGKSYRVDTINRASGEILIERIGQPGTIIVQFKGRS